MPMSLQAASVPCTASVPSTAAGLATLSISASDTQMLRPQTLAGPEREPIEFNINLVGAPPEVEQLVEQIKSVAEQFLYHWKSFPIVLPQALASSGLNLTAKNATNSVSSRNTRPINLRDLFIAPPFDELDAVASDGSGEPRRLTSAQLKTLRETGEFDVPSLHFPGQVHKWRLSQLLQKGKLRAQDSFLSDLALAARFVVVTARARILSHFFSVVQAMHGLLEAFTRLADMFIGVPALLAHNLDYKIKEERCRFLIAELVCRPEYEDCLHGLCSYVRKMLRRATMEKFDFNSCEVSQPVPYLFLTPKGQEIDLRLFCRDIMRKALPILIGILERETRGWFLHFRERLIAELRAKKLNDKEIEEEVNEAVMKEYLQRVYSSIVSDAKLAELGGGVPELLVQQAQSVVIMYKAVDKVEQNIRLIREDHKKCLANDHSVLSRVAPWLRSKLRHAEENRLHKSAWSAHEEALKMCTQNNLHQTAYFLSRDLIFMKEREPVLLKELKNAKTPTRSFQWACRIWSPQSWIIRRNFQGQSDVIPTVISQHATSIVTPRSDPSQPVFLVEKEILRTTSTRWPFWRLLNMIQRIWCWSWNMMFLLGILVPWCSPLGLRALCCVKPFMPDLELSQINGTLFPRKTSITQTLASRLIELWRHISKSRTHFETEPDTGFIGKGLTRNLNRTWNYFVKGFLGTMVILFAFPLICLAASLLSIILAVTAPLWIPLFVLLLHIYMILIYDLDAPDNMKNRYCILMEAIVWNLLIQGLLQPVAAILMATLICPLAAGVVFIVGVIRYSLRLVWDSLTYHLFIKKCGRVPASDSIAVKRIAGPGLALDYYFIIRPEQALAALEAKMELDELQAYQHATERVVLQPQQDFLQFVEACFGPFSAQISKTGPYLSLDREAQDLMSTLHEKLEKRRRELQTALTTQVKSRIKLNTKELKIAIQLAAHILEKYYPSHVIGRLSISEEEFWDNKGLTVNDWPGLAGLIYTDIFSLDFLTPLTEHDTHFKLEPHASLDLMRYTEMVKNANDVIGSKGLDLLGNVYAPRGNVQVHLPFLEVTAFNPRSRITLTFRKPEKRDMSVGLTTPRVRAHRAQHVPKTLQDAQKSWRPWKQQCGENSVTEKLLIPLPVPHPVHIAIAIYNRDTEQPIPLDSELVWEILKSIEDCQGGDAMGVQVGARYRGAAIESSNDSLDSSSSIGSTRDSGSGSVSGSALGNGTETLPCGNREVSTQVKVDTEPAASSSGFHWTLSNWGAAQTARRRTNSNVRVDLASPEDISLDTDSSRAVFNNAYGTTV
ncbi:uncharacterized protein LOC122620516 isoform X1 [Drosophila teissieri]|uniref:uncharacterized protein LOC122620516 isoform X1 n=1 Tax=Drosophila teissieri TaxID=7243 RepID=UPI001CB9F149|nr:uncharacterized protein LOC122620516 isoform X1 [Drosophila teissieri]XP_043653947.1 uncharacterized protein LOC122620516 isoform X1 [Drosophila teissieri]XP_043653948.1 uncharacterized protein LOC122620516 isoform X1 [Drosophila teissieri]